MFKLSTQLSHHHRHILRRMVPPAARISFSTTHITKKSTPQSVSEKGSDRKIPSKDDISTISKEGTRSGTNDEIAHTGKVAYGSTTNPTEEKALADSEEKTDEPGNPLEYSPATPQVSHQGEDKRPAAGTKDRTKTSGGSKNAT